MQISLKTFWSRPYASGGWVISNAVCAGKNHEEVCVYKLFLKFQLAIQTRALKNLTAHNDQLKTISNNGYWFKPGIQAPL